MKLTTREMRASYSARYRANNPEKIKATRAKRRDAIKVMERERHLGRYGLTHEMFELILESQGNVCAICGTDEPGNTRGPAAFRVDHDHDTGEVRGLLCNKCNIAIGYLKDDPALLRRALEYLEAS